MMETQDQMIEKLIKCGFRKSKTTASLYFKYKYLTIRISDHKFFKKHGENENVINYVYKSNNDLKRLVKRLVKKFNLKINLEVNNMNKIKIEKIIIKD